MMYTKIDTKYGTMFFHKKTIAFIEDNGVTVIRFLEMCVEDDIHPAKIIGALNKFFKMV